MILVDNAAQIGTVLRIRAIPLVQHFAGLLKELLLHLLAAQYVVGSDTCLAGVYKLAPQDAPRGDSDIGRTVQVARAFAAELQCAGRQVFTARLVDDFADASGTGIEHVVELFLQQLARFLRSTSYHPVAVLRV